MSPDRRDNRETGEVQKLKAEGRGSTAEFHSSISPRTVMNNAG
jgi:hypothetical protein